MRACRPKSSLIDRIAFDDETATLCISFKDTGRYVYADVPVAMFEAFCDAPSAGRFFNDHIKDHFRVRRDPERRRFGPNA